MFFGTISPTSGSGREAQRGYSLIELIASLLLIAAIAVLSLPTYQDFAPHGETSGLAASDQQSDQLEPAVATTSDSSKTDQPVSSHVVPDDQGNRDQKEVKPVEK